MKNLLLHICCAPDATVPVLDLLKAGYNVKGFFYGNNIQPFNEYEKRLEALKILIQKTNLDVEIAPYNPDEWLEKTSFLKNEPEGGKRCELCFRLQFEAAALTANRFLCSDFTTTLTISPHKNVNKIFEIGSEISRDFNLNWQNIIWRKNNGFLRSINLSKEFGLYRQNYCGCIFSKKL